MLAKRVHAVKATAESHMINATIAEQAVISQR